MTFTPDESAAAMFSNDDVAREMGMAVEAVEVDAATVTMTVTEEMTNGLGVCHGGLLFTLADTAMAYASNARNERTVSTSASIEWLRPAVAGDHLSARCIAVGHRGRNTVYDISVRNERDEEIALVRGQTLTLGGPSLPPTP